MNRIMKTFALLMFVASLIFWIHFIIKGMLLHMWIANAFMWISYLIHKTSSND